MSSTTLNLTLLLQACSTNGAAIRIITKLQPVGGENDKVFPPTYAGEKHAVYAIEDRRVGDRIVKTVLLDSVPSQANRFEQALLQAVEDGQLQIPVLEVNFQTAFEGRKKVTSIDAPHRIADALIRDSLVVDKESKTPFLKSTIGKEFVTASYADATALFKYCPTALIFGVWDSHGSGGGLGNKFARALVSEIVGFEAVEGVRTGGRIDPFNIGKKLGEAKIYEHSTDKWTFTETEAALDKKGKAILVGGQKDKGKPAAIGHGTIPPAVVEDENSGEPYGGGVTLDHALQTTVLSFPQLRRLRFPGGDKEKATDRHAAGRAVLAALALHAIALQRTDGYLLRSRSHLVPDSKEPQKIQFIDEHGKDSSIDAEALSATKTKTLLTEAVAAAKELGLTWEAEKPIKLEPSAKLLKLLELSQAGRGQEEDQA